MKMNRTEDFILELTYTLANKTDLERVPASYQFIYRCNQKSSLWHVPFLEELIEPHNDKLYNMNEL